jgi:hypothetical protein
MDDSRLRRIAADFWSLSGNPLGFPRDIEASILWSLPLAVAKLPRLRVASVRAWLSHNGIPEIVPAAERELRACVVASRGRGVIFIDGRDAPDEQRVSLAHELAHFLLDYQLPREQATAVFGQAIVPVLDGKRLPTDAERLSAVLRGVTLGVYSRLWLRGPLGLIHDEQVLAREDAADELALELLAPKREVVARSRGLIAAGDHADVAELLHSAFGLPDMFARPYARMLCACAKPAKSMKQWLGID